MDRSPSLSRQTTLLFCVYFLVSGALFASIGIGRLFSEWDWLNDLHYYLRGAEMATGEQRAILYDPAARVEAGLGSGEGSEVFPFPATVALLFWPLTFLAADTARLLFFSFSLACAAAVVAMAYAWSRDARFALLVFLAQVSMFTFWETLRFSQLSPVLAALGCAALLALERQRSVSGVLAGVMMLKPSIGLAPVALVAWLGPKKATLAAVWVSIILLGVVPLALLGPAPLADYVRQLSDYRREAFHLQGWLTAGAGWMLNWNGFVGRALDRDPPAALVYTLAGATLVLLASIVWRRHLFDSWLAGALATLLVVPHSLWYDWLLLLGVAPFALYRRRSPAMALLLLALHFGVSFDSYAIVTTDVYDRRLFLTTPLAFGLLLYLAWAGARQARRPGRERAAVSAPAS